MEIVLPTRKPRQRPRMLVCYLCAREFGSKSLPIHIPQCQKKWLLEEEHKPKNERHPLPLPPAEKPIKTASTQEIDEYNDDARAAFEASLEQCPHCQRRFVPKAFKQHANACTAANPAKPAGTGLTPMSLTNRLVPGAIAGSMHGRAKTQPPPLYRKIGLYNGKLKNRMLDRARSPGDRDALSHLRSGPGQTSKSSINCDHCGTPYERPNAKFCSQCGSKKSGTWRSSLGTDH